MKDQFFTSARGIVKEFKTFAIKGNAFELAIAVVVGGAFGKVVSSLVADIVTPTLALVTGGADFKNLSLTLREATDTVPAVALTYGAFLQSVFDFLLIALAIFVVFKIFSAARKRMFKEEEEHKDDATVPQHEKPAEERLLEEIRDLLRRSVEGGSRRAD